MPITDIFRNRRQANQTMTLAFYGAGRTVTGSQQLLTTDAGPILIDCGMFQGGEHMRRQNRVDFHFDPATIKALLLTHAHIDHCGLLPRLVADGFKGRIFTTKPTADLCEIMLLDAAHIQEEDAEYDLIKWQKHGRVGPPPLPLYTSEDVAPTIERIQPVACGEVAEVLPGVRVRFLDAGHILGSAIIEVWMQQADRETKLVFSGDLGRSGQVLLRDPEPVVEADYLVIESTYGNRLHSPAARHEAEFARIVKHTIRGRGHLLIPAFAVGRTQTILYELNQLVESGQVTGVPVFLDSPLAIKATEIVRRHTECFDQEALALLAKGDKPTDFPGLRFTESVDESKAINTTQGPFIVIVGSGMCTAGRIRHHLRNHLKHKHDTVLLVGFQAAGTLGRILEDGAKKVKLFGEWYPVKARIESLSGFSAHADMRQLLDWAARIEGLKQVFVTHGEEDASLDFAATLHRRLGLDAYTPEAGFVADLRADDALGRYRREAQEIWRRPPSQAELTLD